MKIKIDRYLKLLLVGVLIGTLSLSGIFGQSVIAENTDDSESVGTTESVAKEPEIKDINQKIASIDINNATLQDIIKIFGEPKQYFWGDTYYTKDQLPSIYVAEIENGFYVLFHKNLLNEIRFEGDESLTDLTGYSYKNALKIGSSREEVLKVLGSPKKTVEGGNNNTEDGVLYMNIGAKADMSYYCVRSQGVGIFFYKDKVSGIYLLSKGTPKVNTSQNVTESTGTTNENDSNNNAGSTVLSSGNQLTIAKHPPAADYSMHKAKLTALPIYDAKSSNAIILRQKDLSDLDLTKRINDLRHSDFDTETIWPLKMPKDFNPQKVMKSGMNQGLGIKTLQARGITGKGVNIGIIDQALLVDHQEYKDRVKLYEEIHCLDQEASMHGPGMASLAVGKNIGVAPSADLYFIGNTNMNPIGNDQTELDFTYTAKAVDRMLQINNMLPKGDKIRVISISTSFCPENKGYKELTQAIERAKKAGIFVVTCNLFETYGHKFWYQGLDRDPLADPEKSSSYSVYPWKNWLFQIHHLTGTDFYYEKEFNKYQPKEVLLLPVGSKTFAYPTGTDKYLFTREGGWSSAEPYLAGLYAMACQVKPNVTPELFLTQALKTGDTKVFSQNNKKYTGKVINPVKLIQSLQNGK